MDSHYLDRLLPFLTKENSVGIYITDKNFIICFTKILEVLHIRDRQEMKNILSFFYTNGYISIIFVTECYGTDIRFSSRSYNELKEGYSCDCISQEDLLLGFSNFMETYKNIEVL